MAQDNQALTDDQIEAYVAQIADIQLLPDTIQDEALNDLVTHYQIIVSSGNVAMIERDLQHASAIISWSMQGQSITAALEDHSGYFGEASMQDVIRVVGRLRSLTGQSS